MKKSIFHKLSDITIIHHRAAFADVEKRIASQESVFMTLARNRYSCRNFSDAPVSDTEISHIIEAARLAPSAENKQPVHVWVLRSPEALSKLDSSTQYRYGAPVVFMVGCNPKAAWVRKYDGKNGAEIDAAIVGTHIMLEAAALGLGNVWVGSFDPEKIAADFPETAGYEIVALFPVGHPAKDDAPGPRHAERVSKEEFVTEL